jgi:DNA polymerase-3 subunit beta
MSRITIDAKALSGALSRATGAVNRVKSNPALLCVRLGTEEGELLVDATDMDRVITVRVPCEGELDQQVLVDYGRLIGVVASIKDRGEMTMEVKGDAVLVVSGRSRFTLPFFKAEVWPNLDEAEWPHRFEIEAPKLVRLMTALQPAISSDETRYYICGICLEPGSVIDARQADSLVAIATDGHKIYARSIDVPGMPAIDRITVPTMACLGIAKLFAEADKVQVACSDRKLRVSVDGLVYITKLVEGHFPDWRRVAPLNLPSAFSYDLDRLTAAAQAAAAAMIGEKKGKAVKVTFRDGETELEAKDFSNAGFTGFDVVPHSDLGQPQTEVMGVNVDYLLEMIASLDAETIEIAPSTTTAIAVRGGGMTDRIVGIMPMRV